MAWAGRVVTQGDTGMGTIAYPGDSFSLGAGQFTYHLGYEVWEMWCDDFDGTQWTWSMHGG